ncbi:MAG: KUP/HAK/KT family potassium transporter [Myxococcales bacterium]|nr:KUP/HAK/KT family potassium transporter [Myxococcales bacterium]
MARSSEPESASRSEPPARPRRAPKTEAEPTKPKAEPKKAASSARADKPPAPPKSRPTHGPVSLRDAPAGGHGRLGPLALAALGVVYGDIGTSPLYALRECFHGEHAIAATRGNVLGVLSLMAWALVIVVTLKYLIYVLRADNRGEGGELALMALALSSIKGKLGPKLVVVLGIFGASLLYGDGMITPAISVLSAIEGLEVAAPASKQFVIPATIVILIGLFMIQKRGTAGIGAVFGPVMLIWFSVLATVGTVHIFGHPSVLQALSPHHAVRFMLVNKTEGFLVLGAVFLVVTGGEALYADMGHFGRRPIQVTWIFFVGPALLLTYFGQGALLLENPAAASNPFYRSLPSWALYPMLGLATMATIIASQAVISGAFSYTRQGMMLGFWPRIEVKHTSSTQIGQIYVPAINWMLMFSTIALVLGFGSSSKLAAAYGTAVTTTMVITTLLAYVVARHRWGWSAPAAVSLTLGLLVVDLAFWGAQLVKIPHGGWVPLVIAGGVFALMTTWKDGRVLLGTRMRERIIPLADFFELILIERPARVPGTAVFMTSNADGAPPALLQNFTHNRVVHQQVILLTVVTTEQPRVMPDERVTVEDLPQGFRRVVARYGFMEQPDIPQLLEERHLEDWSLEHTTFFLGRETLLATKREGMALWREHLFAFMSRNSQRASTFFNVPSDRVMEVGSQIEL